MIKLLLGAAFNPLGSRLAVCAACAVTLAASYRVALVRRQLERFYGACAFALTAHYFYLYAHNPGDQNWVAGSYVTVLAIGVTIEGWALLAAYSACVLVASFLVSQKNVGNAVDLPGMMTVLILINFVAFLREKAEKERARRSAAEAASRAKTSFLAAVSHVNWPTQLGRARTRQRFSE